MGNGKARTRMKHEETEHFGRRKGRNENSLSSYFLQHLEDGRDVFRERRCIISVSGKF